MNIQQLMVATLYNHTEIANLLIESGATPLKAIDLKKIKTVKMQKMGKLIEMKRWIKE